MQTQPITSFDGADRLARLRPIFDLRFAKDIAFRPLARADVFPLFQATRDPAFNQYLLWLMPQDEAETLVQVEKLLRQDRLGQALVLSLCDRPTGAWRGMAVLKPFRDGLELSLYIHPDQWSRGTVFTCGRGVIEVAFEQLPDLVLYTRIRPGNQRMERICKHYRFVPTDPSSDMHARDGKIDLDVYRLDKQQWETFAEVQRY